MTVNLVIITDCVTNDIKDKIIHVMNQVLFKITNIFYTIPIICLFSLVVYQHYFFSNILLLIILKTKQTYIMLYQTCSY